MIGTISLRDLRIICVIGVNPKERESPQALLVDVDLDLDFAEAAETDDVGATANYSEVAARLEELAVDGQFHLLETLAEEAAGMLFEYYAALEALRLTVRKPSAVPAAACAAVTIERRREDYEQ
ncbi:MAG: dihydroneopterin aldolase [Candidatus Sumerlaeota bacterium]|nr:dihydroneopterin aldolase [Candidatus Sumerlaeota bacterium]